MLLASMDSRGVFIKAIFMVYKTQRDDVISS